jgi:protein-S-isoprenylcysteine O-methyltransferase Ste14
MTNLMRVFLLIVGNALALLLALLALETTPTNFLGWFLFAIGIAYGAGGVIYLWRERNVENVVKSETGNRSFWWILPGFMVIFFAPPLEFLHLPASLPRGIGMELAGLITMLSGLLLRVWTRLSLGGMYSGYLRIGVGHVLVTGGPYHFIRHPCYTGFIIMALGLALGYSSLIGLIAIPALMIPGLAYRIKVEERLLSEVFRDDFWAYARRSKRLIPWVW